ncbi:MAG: tetratricopeptide repeat protein [Asgard group archaeon]|nr:tetratricopeptide repeat protein [Asgard group archaeon]
MASDISDQIAYIENQIEKGLYRKALEDIKKLENITEKNFIECLNCQILKSRILFNLGYYEESYEIIIAITEKTKINKKYDLYLKALIVEIEISYDLGKYENILTKIYEAEKYLSGLPRTESSKIYEVQLILLKGHYFSIKSEFNNAYEIYKKALELSRKINSKREEAKALYRIGLMNRLIGKYDKAIEYMQQVLIIGEELEDVSLKALIFKNLGSIYSLIGELEKSLTCTKKSLEMYKIVGSILDLGMIYINQGVAYEYSGKLSDALKNYNVALNIFRETNNKWYIAAAYNNIAGIQLKQGRLHESLNNIKLALQAFQEINHTMNIVAAFNTIGHIYHYLGDLKEAYIHLKFAYQLKEKIKNNLSISRTISYLIAILVDLGELGEAIQILNDFDMIVQQQKNKTIFQRYLISKALIYEQSENQNDKINARKLFIEIIEDEITDYEITINASISYCHNLLDDLLNTIDQQNIKEIEKQIDIIKTYSKKQQSIYLEIEGTIINARLKLIMGEREEGLELFKQAQQIANKIDYKLILLKYDKYFKNNDLDLRKQLEN